MTIYQLKERCWELQPPLDDEHRPHYDTEAEAREALDEATDEAGDADPATKPVQLAAPCWLVRCDGDCNEHIDEDGECYTYHHDSRADAEQTTSGHDFRRVGDLVFCQDDAPEDSELFLSSAELEAAGQMRLPGVA